MDEANQNGDNNIKVIARVRPLLKREIDALGPVESIVTISEDKKIMSLKRLQSDGQAVDNRSHDVKAFKFDECVWSFDRNTSVYMDNYQFYESIGPHVVDELFRGYNMCLIAYGQTSSGKTYTMSGGNGEDGLIALIMKDILRFKEHRVSERIDCEIIVSYVEVYNEKVKDLLATVQREGKKCKVREHPVHGPYIENIVEKKIDSFEQFITQLEDGTNRRATASTAMNNTSSRSHAIISITLKQTKFLDNSTDNCKLVIGNAEEVMTSNIKLIDLAGSERLSKTNNFGQADRMREGAQINKSLTVLGRCISCLSSNSLNPHQKPKVVPYRDSILSYLLKENLGGNSKSYMIFCVSPTDYEETLQTLNYAKQVKNIKTSARANKISLDVPEVNLRTIRESDASLIQSLKEEVGELTAKLKELEINTSEPNQRVSPQFDKFGKLIKYLEQDSRRINFENKFLRDKITQKDKEIIELKLHTKYMDSEFSRSLSTVENSHISQNVINGTIYNMLSRCSLQLQEFDDLVDRYDPRKL